MYLMQHLAFCSTCYISPDLIIPASSKNVVTLATKILPITLLFPLHRNLFPPNSKTQPTVVVRSHATGKQNYKLALF